MKRFLREASKEYYDGNPVISDDVFDAIERLSETEEVGFRDGEIEHKYRMYSLDKVYSLDEVKLQNTVETPKLDGAAISILYLYGKLDIALTRGDGKKGFDITDKVKHLVKNTINTTSPAIFITGEVVSPKTIPNSRNFSSGSLKLKEQAEFEERVELLKFVAYDAKGLNTETYLDTLKELNTLGFSTVNDSSWNDYPQDGKVIRVNSNKEYENYGFTAKHPRGAIALKDRSEEEIKETTLKEVIWQVGGSKVTPVAIFDEVILGGAKVTRATLHNAGFVEELDLHIGDTLLVRRSGSIIPGIIGKVEI